MFSPAMTFFAALASLAAVAEDHVEDDRAVLPDQRAGLGDDRFAGVELDLGILHVAFADDEIDVVDHRRLRRRLMGRVIARAGLAQHVVVRPRIGDGGALAAEARLRRRAIAAAIRSPIRVHAAGPPPEPASCRTMPNNR
jgi:hypothetical protein